MRKQSLQPPTTVEKVAGHPIAELLATAATLLGGPLVPFLPVLGTTLASGRQALRVQAAIATIDERLSANENALRHISDEQYKVINETVIALLHTTEAAKIEYLQNAVTNGVTTELVPLEAAVLSRMIRDLSAEEVRFILHTFGAKRIWLSALDTVPDVNPDERGTYYVGRNSREGLIASGLLSMGVLLNDETTVDAGHMLTYAGITVKLIALVESPKHSVD